MAVMGLSIIVLTCVILAHIVVDACTRIISYSESFGIAHAHTVMPGVIKLKFKVVEGFVERLSIHPHTLRQVSIVGFL